ncbi:hypothetical protein Thena_0940 [Thermodesulfobium narugense DSM 14796]|uniref:Uncharacterized protein n=1 Tax=Thermodesulfobium narugense DSM 14796 TaxID=747365 RepID=M1E8M8_9BACT|nr:hypothetical protein [Thermodesulfobium narugense]AEE14569.1 hypothetical protein Thena_0940 [Thermodesulfobium narugense DSM 14796]
MKENYNKLYKYQVRLEEIKYYTMLALAHKNKDAQKGFEYEFNDLYGKYFFLKIATNALFFVILIPYILISSFLLDNVKMLFYPVNYIFVCMFLYFIFRFFFLNIKNFNLKN